MHLFTVRIEKPDHINFIPGQSHFIKTVEDLHEARVTAVPGTQLGVAFCEAFGPALVRWSGTDGAMLELARTNALSLGCGPSSILLLGDGFYPVNVLKVVQGVPEVAGIFCATAHPTEVIVAETEQGRGILGVIDGMKSQGLEGEEEIAARRALLHRFGYKLS